MSLSLYNPESESMTKRGVNMEPIHREAFRGTYVLRRYDHETEFLFISLQPRCGPEALHERVHLEVEEGSDMMLLDALILLKEQIQPFHSVVHAVKVYVVPMA